MTVQPDLEWQRLWYTLRGRAWTSLAVLGIDGAAGAGDVASRLAMVGNLDKKVPVRVISALGMSYQDVTGVIAQISPEASTEPVLTVVACDSPQVNPAMIPIIQATSGAVLVVRLGDSLLDSVRKTVEVVGREKVLATVSVG